MGILSRIINFIKGDSKKSQGSQGTRSVRSPKRSINDFLNDASGSRSVGQYGTSASYRRALIEERKKKEKKTAEVREAFKAKEFAPTSDSPTNNAKTRLEQKLDEARKNRIVEPPKPKKLTEKQERIEAARTRRENERKAYHAATNHRYDVNEAGISDEERLRRRQAQKSQAYDLEAEKYETKAHPIATSAARGALSGVTFGASELALRNSKARKESGAEEFYQKHKNKTAEAVGEIGGSLVSFGGTAGATEKLATKVGGRAIERGAERLAENAIVKGAAKRSVNRAVKKGLVKEGSEELIKQVGKEKARRVARALGTDIVQNLTTGALYDVLKASTEHEVNSSDWWKEIGKSAALNAAITGGVAGISAARGGKRMAVEAAERLARGNADDAVKAVARNADNSTKGIVEFPPKDDSTIEVVGGRGGRTVEIGAADEGIDVINPNVRRAAQNADEAVEEAAPNYKVGLNRKRKTDVRLPNERLTASASGDSWKSRLADADDFDAFVKENAKNPDVRAYVIDEENGVDGLEKLWRDTRISESKQRLREISLEEADDILERSLPNSTRLEWFQNENSLIKPKLAHYLAKDPDLVNAGMTVAYRNYADSTLGKPLPFDEWLTTPQKMYRGTHGQKMLDEDIFSAFTPDRRVAEKFAGKSENAHIEEITIRPIDTYGSYAISGEQEILVPKEIIENAKREAQNVKATPPEVRAETKATPPRAGGGFATVDEAMPSTDPALTAENETRSALERRVDEIAEDIPFTDENGNPVTGENLKVNKVADDEAVSGALPSGVNQVRSAYEYNNGKEPKLEDGILTSWNEAWKASQEYSASHATGDKNRMSKVAVSQLNAMDSEAERELRQRLADSGELNYDAISSADLYDKIAKQMRDDPNRWIKDMIEINEGGALDFRSTPEWQARVQYIMGTVDPSADTASEIAYTEAFKLAQNISSKGGQTLNLRRNFVHLTPMGKRDAILDDFINILGKSKGFVNNHPKLNSLGRFDKREYIRNILMEDDAIKDGVEKLVKANELDDVSEAFTELMLNVNKKNPKAGFDVIQELRYLNMLGNPKTHIRNVLGSAFFSPMRQVSNGIRSMLEKPIEQYARRASGGAVEVTRHGGLSLVAAKEAWVKNPTTEAGKAALEAFKKNKAEILGSAKYETTTYTGRGKTLAGKGLDRLSDFNSRLLSGEDDFFRSRAYRENYIKSYNRYVKDGKPITDKVKRRIEKEALQESQIATFNEYNNFAKWLSNITSKANDANASTLARWGGRGVNAVMPFTKVPANLMKQSINYSPLGIAKGFANIKTAAKKGDAELLNRAIDELASGLTGTAVFGLGMLLGKTTDMFTTNTGKNDPAAKFKKDRGMQNYSISFKDPETGQGHSFTLDWLVPTSATFFSGIEMAKQLQSGDFNLLDIGGDWSTVMTRLAEPVMETSMLSGLHGMLETMRGGYGDDDTKSAIGILLRETVQSYASSMIPTALGQISRTAYKTDMQITGDDDWEYFWNQTKSKAGLANTKILGEPLGADTDAYGNVKGEKNDAADYVKSGLKNFLSPANIQKVDFSEVDNAKIAEYERRVKDGESPEDLAYLFPKKQYKKQFKVAGEEVKMSNRDLSAYNQAKTKGGEEGMRFVLENIMFNRQTVDEKGKKVPADSAYTKEEKAKLMQQFKGKSMREVEEWLYEQPEFKNATDAERKKAIDGLWKLTKDTKAVASQRVGEQAVIKAQGGDVNEYNFKNEVTEKKRKALEPLIAAGVVTYEEAVDFARNAGKTYYTENEEGGSSATYYNKKEMIQYLIDKGYSYEKAEALFNAFKQSNAKPYSGNNLSSGRRGYRRRGYRRYGRRRGGGGSSGSGVEIPAAKASAYTAKAFSPTAKVTPPTARSRGTTSLAASLKAIQDTEAKVKAPIKRG